MILNTDNCPLATTQRVAYEIARMANPSYARFLHKVLPGQEDLKIHGVKIPQLRALARRLAQAQQRQCFLDALPHPSLEENLLHGLLINGLPDGQATLTEIQRFLPHVSNWMVCDTTSPQAFRQHPEILQGILPHWLAPSAQPYTQRFACLCLMRYFLGPLFQTEHLQWVTALPTSHRYVRTGAAWYLAEALIAQPRHAWPCLLSPATPTPLRLTALQKAVESNRSSADDKSCFRKLIKEIRHGNS